MKTTITPQGRIAGSRISVHDVYYYLKSNTPHTEIALILGLYPEDVLAAIHYIVEHDAEMERIYQAVEARAPRFRRNWSRHKPRCAPGSRNGNLRRPRSATVKVRQ